MVIALRAARASAIARRVQSRTLIAAWERGDLNLTEMLTPPRADRIFVTCAAIALWLAWLWFVIFLVIPGWRSSLALPAAQRPLAHITAAGLAIGPLCLPLLYTWTAWNLARYRSILISLRSDTLRLAMRGSEPQARAWASLRAIRPVSFGLELCFDDGTIARLYRPLRAGVILRHRAAQMGEKLTQTSKVPWNLRIRIALWFLIGGLLGALLVYYVQSLGIALPQTPLNTFLMLGIGMPAVLFGAGALGTWMERRLERRFRWSQLFSARRRPKAPLPPPP